MIADIVIIVLLYMSWTRNENENPALLRHRVKDLFKTRPRTYTILQRRLAHAGDSSRSSVVCPVDEDRSPLAEDFSKSSTFEVDHP